LWRAGFSVITRVSEKHTGVNAMDAAGVRGLLRPEGLWLDDGGETAYGGNQEWYSERWQRQAGCGPTVCAHLMWYLALTRPACAALADVSAPTRAGFLRLMSETWRYVTPGLRGVNRPDMLAGGAERFGLDRGLKLAARTLPVPPLLRDRPPTEAVLAFVAEALSLDTPVAFLNLSSGGLPELDSWHWVTLVALGEAGVATVYDAGRRWPLDIPLWLRKTALGGGFVAVLPG
jgi:hypothetical protein